MKVKKILSDIAYSPIKDCNILRVSVVLDTNPERTCCVGVESKINEIFFDKDDVVSSLRNLADYLDCEIGFE